MTTENGNNKRNGNSRSPFRGMTNKKGNCNCNSYCYCKCNGKRAWRPGGLGALGSAQGG